jgi:hypothetical protein
MKFLTPILIAFLLGTSPCNGHTSREDRLAALPTSQNIDPTTDPTVGLLYDNVPDLKDSQLYALTKLYIQLREGQSKVIEQIKKGQGDRPKRGERPLQKKEGERPRKSMDGERPDRQKNTKSSQGPRAEMRKKFNTLEQTFLNAGKALLSPSQHAGWDAFVLNAELGPKRPSGGQAKRGKSGDASKRGERGERGDRTRRGKINHQENGNPSAVVSEMNTSSTPDDSAPSFVLSALDGTQHALASITGKPLIVEFGSFTNPEFRKTHPALEQLLTPHAADINFVVIYGPEAYPSDGQHVAMNVRDDINYAQPMNMTARLEIAKIAVKSLNIQTLLLVDDMQNSTTSNWNGSQYSTVIVNADGTIHSRLETTDLSLVRAYIEER